MAGLDTQTKINLLDLDREAMEAYFKSMGEKPFRATQVMKWIYHNGVTDLESMSNLSKSLRERLQPLVEVSLPEIVSDNLSIDGSRKWLMRFADGNAIETVYIPERGRGTLCVSSQVGCTLNCSFCSTAQQGFNRNLTAGEIIGQVLAASIALGIPENRSERTITNVVMMGMGEPLLNFESVVTAMRLMMDDLGFGLSKRRVTLSTSGLVPQMDQLGERIDVSLAVSLHATNDELRDELVPINRKYPIAELMAACRRYAEHAPHGQITMEYVMIDGVNDSIKEAHELARLLKNVPSKINLIPFNPFPGSDYHCSSEETLERFQSILIKAGHITVVRRTRGDDIDAACGQLAGRVKDRTRRSLRSSQERCA